MFSECTLTRLFSECKRFRVQFSEQPFLFFFGVCFIFFCAREDA
jgi:hypothetical protein